MSLSPLRQGAWITLGAGVVLGGFLLLPAGSSLTPMDFLADRGAVLQFCDPQNSRPLQASAGQGPVTLAVTAGPDEGRGVAATAGFTLATASGKPICARDILPRGNPEVRVSIQTGAGGRLGAAWVRPGRRPGQWTFGFTPPGPGRYRVEAAFTPVATGKEQRCAADFVVERTSP
jgi:hypothetical protein